ncbi:hypothetical protein [Streptomyces caelestis]|uniref:Uncharacterized protein n=1 Tax=Streptomyces caelestis TaxID=36816 RepID=A0A7W9H5T4_9ACTN|nr:hypothetical protein [Streptomyces caelestis]MBB5795846.1 hypothetical protein [Streptomyces caelestis]
MSERRLPRAPRRAPVSLARAGSGPDALAVTMASTRSSITMNWGGGDPRAASARPASHSSRARAMYRTG